jgi:transposase
MSVMNSRRLMGLTQGEGDGLNIAGLGVGQWRASQQKTAPKFEARIKELVEDVPGLAVLVEPLLVVRRVLREQISVLHRRLLAIVREDDVCRRLMKVPGVGPVVSGRSLD